MAHEPIAPRSSTPPRLPPDIVREIFRSFANDEQTLLNCALVSQEWLSESQPFIFRSINVRYRHPDVGGRFVTNVLHSERLHPWLTSIHHFSFALMYTPDDEGFIVEISKCLANLRTMSWGGVLSAEGWDSLRPEVFAAFGKFACLHHLEMTNRVFASFEDLKKVIVAFPSLSSLRLSEVSWKNSADSDQLLSTLPSPHIWPKALSKLSLTAPNYLHPPKTIDDALLWLPATPTRYVLKELSLHLSNIGAALRLLAGASLAALNVQMEDDDPLLDDSIDVVQLRPPFSQFTDIELLRLELDIIPLSWDSIARVLRLLRSVASIRRLHLCWASSGSFPLEDSDYNAAMLDDAAAKQLETVLLASPGQDDAFRTLRAIDFTWYFKAVTDDHKSKTLQEQHALFSRWTKRAWPRLCERYAVELYCYDDESMFGLTGYSKHCAYGPDFPHAVDWYSGY